MTLLLLFVTVVLIGMVSIAIINALTFPQLESPPKTAKDRSASWPTVSILIPARNEASVIGQTVSRLLAQTYPDFEIIVLDDHSQDATAEIARSAGYGDARLRVIGGQPLPAGWLGKNWACHQLAQHATGEWLIFVDADVNWQPAALAAVVTAIEQTRADVLTVWPTQHSQNWPERMVVPLMALAIIGYLPLPLVHHTPWPALAAANGQCLAFRRQAYTLIGGHAAVRGEVLEDVILARRVKAHRLRLRMVDGNWLIGCRMYQNWAGVRDGFAKNILAGYGDRIPLLMLATLFHLLIFVMPWVWLILGWWGGVPHWPVWPLLLVSLGVGLRALTASVTHQRVTDAVLLPISVLLMTWIAGQSIWWRWRFGGPCWKGRTLTPKSASGRGEPSRLNQPRDEAPMADPVVVIGAGIGGLSSAIHLAAAGQRVVIFEQNPAAGGTTHPGGGVPLVTLSGRVAAEMVMEDLDVV